LLDSLDLLDLLGSVGSFGLVGLVGLSVLIGIIPEINPNWSAKHPEVYATIESTSCRENSQERVNKLYESDVEMLSFSRKTLRDEP